MFKLIDLSQVDRNYSQSDRQVRQFFERAYRNRGRLYAALGVTVTRKTEAVELLNRLLRKVGLNLRCHRRETIEGERVRVYRLADKLILD